MTQIFGLSFTTAAEERLAATMLEERVPAGDGPRTVLTANLDHVVNLARNRPFRTAYDGAWAVTADGMPVLLYARLRGLPLPGRVTGADLCRRLLSAMDPRRHRPFLVVSCMATAARIRAALAALGFDDAAVRFRVPPHGFDADEAFCEALAGAVREHGTTHLLLGVGSPKSEIWADRFRDVIGDCWVLPCGAGLDFFAGTKARAPRLVQRSGLEWAWRLASEPRRLFRRYVVNSWRFWWVVAADLAGQYG